MLLAAKLEQPVSPNFRRMIMLLTEQEQKNVTKEALVELEEEILTKFGFDFVIPGPIQPLERYLRLLDLH